MKKIILTAAVFLLSSQTFYGSSAQEQSVNLAIQTATTECLQNHQAYKASVATINNNFSVFYPDWQKASVEEKKVIVTTCAKNIKDSISSGDNTTKALTLGIGLSLSLKSCKNKNDITALQCHAWSTAVGNECAETHDLASVVDLFAGSNPALPKEVLEQAHKNVKSS